MSEVARTCNQECVQSTDDQLQCKSGYYFEMYSINTIIGSTRQRADGTARAQIGGALETLSFTNISLELDLF